MYYIYIHTNKKNNKSYVGQTRQKLNQRWRYGEGYKREPKFYNAIKKYGWDNFEHKILAICDTQEEANELEELFIKKYNSYIEGYNLTEGGYNNPSFYPEIRQKISQKISGKNNGMYNKKHSKESREKMRKSARSYWDNRTEEERQALSQRRMGGKNPHAKAVECIETGKIYPCARDAAVSIDSKIDRAQGGRNISSAIKRGTASFGYHWRYVNGKNYY